jgi:molybdopterin-guanine dinucleotide biosynthesis protein A
MGLTSAHNWYGNLRMAYIEGEDLAHCDPRGEIFMNVNTLEELRRAEILATGGIP